MREINNTARTQQRGIAKLKDPASAISHIAGAVAAVFGTVPLLVYAHLGSSHTVWPMAVFMASLFLLYGASGTYHSMNFSVKSNHLLQKLDHMMIYVLIAGTYTPICTLVLDPATGNRLLAVIWGIAAAGMLQAAFWSHGPKWISSVLYIAMGWVCVAVFPQLLESMNHNAMVWLFAGGVIYTIGGVIYAFKFKLFNRKHEQFGSHDIFHLFCLGGSLCHYVMMFFIAQ